MDSVGKLVMESILETKAATILRFFAGRQTQHSGAAPQGMGTREARWALFTRGRLTGLAGL
jgi:hypothetical protein